MEANYCEQRPWRGLLKPFKDMSFSLFFQKAAASVCLCAAIPLLAAAGQVNPVPSGDEYSIVGPLPGNQVNARAAIDVRGGFLVWADNAADQDGLGIRAVGLDSNFQAVQAPFRVNATALGDQEKPQVALYPGGGAVVVWQGGPIGFQHVFARFLSSENTWMSGDVLLSKSTTIQRNPGVAALKEKSSQGDSAVVVWSSYNQHATNSMFDIYARFVGSGGVSSASEFRINQFTDFNQRNPAVASLANGGFVVVWVSEDQSATNAVDIYTRLFSASGAPLSLDLQVNSTANLCANPTVVGTSDGGFIVAWSQKDLLNRNAGWDIVARKFSDSGAVGVEQVLNERTYGDQIAPVLTSVGDVALAAWTSFAQDGDREGIYGRFLGSDGALAGAEFALNSLTQGPQIQPTLAGDGVSRILGIWSSYSRGTAEMDLAAQLYAPAGYLPVVGTTNYSIPVFVDTNPGGGGTDVPPIVDVPDSGSEAYPAAMADGFVRARGGYAGLFYQSTGVAPSSAGYFQMTTTSAGKFSGRVSLAGKNFAISGRFDESGKFAKTIRGIGGKPMTIALEMHLAYGDVVRGSISSAEGWESSLQGSRTVFGVGNLCPQSGTYTMLIPPSSSSSKGPGGYGYGFVKVNPNGVLLWNATLADGTKVTQRSAVSKDGFWPLYASLYKGQGINFSWANLADQTIDGDFVWARPAGLRGGLFPEGFTVLVDLIGGRYTVPGSGVKVLDWSSGSGRLTMSGGGLAQPITKDFVLDQKNRVLGTDGRSIGITIQKKNGTFSGKIKNPATGSTLTVKGTLLQDNPGYGAGYFGNANTIGQVYLEPVSTQ